MPRSPATPMLFLIGAAVLVAVFGLWRSLPPRAPKTPPNDLPLPLVGEGGPARRAAGATEPERSGGMLGAGTGGGEGQMRLTKPLITANDPARGPATAKVTIVEFADFLCPHCAEAEKDLKEILRAYPNDVRLVWKDLPVTPPFDAGLRAHQAARCAGAQGKFWEYHDALFTFGGAVGEEMIFKTATDLGLDREAWTACLEGGEMKPAIERTIEEARRLGLTGVPTFFVNGEKIETLTIEAIKKYLE